MTARHRAAPLVLGLALLTATAGCTAGARADADLTFTDAWAKAADSGMTAAFGTLTNATDSDVTVVAAESHVARMELHEVVRGSDGAVMRPKDGGLVVPARGTLTLEPGGDHLMFLDLTAPLVPGDDVDVTLVSADGATWSFSVPIRTFEGADEDYHPQHGSTSDS